MVDFVVVSSFPTLARNAPSSSNAYCRIQCIFSKVVLLQALAPADSAVADCMLLASRSLALPVWKLAAGKIGRPCSRPYRLHSSTVGHTLCSAPIKASRQDVDSIRQSNSKFPFADEFKLLHGEKYDSAQVIQGLGPLLTSKRLESINKVCFVMQHDKMYGKG